ncbi:peroxiredoxin [Aliidongia dinghuensis]|uniref:thioredoxin-dependent peroxiredoxin n=1 Tax=Aliidongia dinghuensis TaxID=1867774 RepID=A0A8J2YXN0_9PROT|nr:peroxiredoxin [Aliidongia dinghuensis]GGF29319.1 peroxiredoxin [Aliidongia dinghuensis]
MKRVLAATLLAGLTASPALAALKPGDAAPKFTAPATLAGKEFTFKLADALKHGPVVLYFYPAAFTKGCSAEAHDFAEATERFKALGAMVVGISADKIAVLDKFSTADCQSKFAVAADPELTVAKSYDAVMAKNPSYADRTSYVISPDGKILSTYSSLDPDGHVASTIAAVEKWRTEHKG